MKVDNLGGHRTCTGNTGRRMCGRRLNRHRSTMRNAVHTQQGTNPGVLPIKERMLDEVGAEKRFVRAIEEELVTETHSHAGEAFLCSDRDIGPSFGILQLASVCNLAVCKPSAS